MVLAKSYSRPQGIHLLDALLARGQRIFTTQDAHAVAQELGILPTTASWALGELARSGWVKRLRRGLYAIDEASRGGHSPHPFAIATALVQPSAISHWSALAHHGLTEQIPRVVTATTPKDVLTPRMRTRRPVSDGSSSTWDIDGLSIRYIRVRPDRFWGTDQVWVDEFSRVSITDRERTILDGFVSPEVFGSLHEVLGALEEHFAEIDIPRLVSYAIRYRQGSAIKRLGYILEQLDAPSDVLQPLRQFPIKGFRLLDPQGSAQGEYVTSWSIRDNTRRK